jgi:hypothetical protein
MPHFGSAVGARRSSIYHSAASAASPTNQPDAVRSAYFNFTNNKTKIAHTPTVIGNCAKATSRTAPPLGSANVRKNITSAVSIPTTNLLFQFIDVPPARVPSPTSFHRTQPHVSGRVYPEGARYIEEWEGLACEFGTSRSSEGRDSVSQSVPERSQTGYEAPYACNGQRLLKNEKRVGRRG